MASNDQNNLINNEKFYLTLKICFLFDSFTSILPYILYSQVTGKKLPCAYQRVVLIPGQIGTLIFILDLLKGDHQSF